MASLNCAEWTDINLEVPKNLQVGVHTKLIRCDYRVELVISIGGLHRSSRVFIPVTIGTRPFRIVKSPPALLAFPPTAPPETLAAAVAPVVAAAAAAATVSASPAAVVPPPQPRHPPKPPMRRLPETDDEYEIIEKIESADLKLTKLHFKENP